MDRDKERLAEHGAALLIKIRNAHFETRKGLAVLLKPMYQGFGCVRCELPWNVTEGHTTKISPFESCFALCEKCWEDLSPEERLPFYKALFEKWQGDEISRKEAPPEKWQKIKTAVLAGK